MKKQQWGQNFLQRTILFALQWLKRYWEWPHIKSGLGWILSKYMLTTIINDICAVQTVIKSSFGLTGIPDSTMKCDFSGKIWIAINTICLHDASRRHFACCCGWPGWACIVFHLAVASVWFVFCNCCCGLFGPKAADACGIANINCVWYLQCGRGGGRVQLNNQTVSKHSASELIVYLDQKLVWNGVLVSFFSAPVVIPPLTLYIRRSVWC